MQCNYLHQKGNYVNDIENECKTGPARYITTPEDRSNYCDGVSFRSCPRFVAILLINKSNNGNEA